MARRLLCTLLRTGDLLGQAVIDAVRDGDLKCAFEPLGLARLGKAGSRGAQIRAASRCLAAQINTDLALGAAHDAHQFALGALGITAHAPAHGDLFLL